MKYDVEWRGQKYTMEWFEETNFEELENATQAYGFIFNEDKKVCIVNFRKDYWTLPGGTPEEYDKTFEDTLKREADEEADLDLKNVTRVGYFKVTPISDNCERKDIHYALRFAAEVDKLKEQTIDPDEGFIPERKFISPKDFKKYTGWDNGAFQLKKAMEALYNESKI